MDQALEIIEEVTEEQVVVELTTAEMMLIGGGTLAGSIF